MQGRMDRIDALVRRTKGMAGDGLARRERPARSVEPSGPREVVAQDRPVRDTPRVTSTDDTHETAYPEAACRTRRSRRRLA